MDQIKCFDFRSFFTFSFVKRKCKTFIQTKLKSLNLRRIDFVAAIEQVIGTSGAATASRLRDNDLHLRQASSSRKCFAFFGLFHDT